jgi:glycosyltransferase involved in cell wall biosynthesis
LKRLAFRLYYEPILLLTRTRVLCSSEADRQSLEDVAPRLAATARVLPNGVELGAFLSLAREPVPGRIVVVGRVARSKGIEHLFRALVLIRDTNWSLEIDGADEGAEVARLAVLGSKLGIASRVVFEGAFGVGEEPAILRGAAIAVFPSEAEGFGIALLDAMAAAVPVVASDLPAHQQLLGDYATSLTVGVGDPDQLAATIRSQLEMSSASAADLGARLRDRARTYDVARVVNELDEMYRSLAIPVRNG